MVFVSKTKTTNCNLLIHSCRKIENSAAEHCSSSLAETSIFSDVIEKQTILNWIFIWHQMGVKKDRLQF